jgi:hypothetical protein
MTHARTSARTITRTRKDETIAVRLPGELREALERERQARSKKAGADVSASAVIRSILEHALR